ncbi:MAG: ABC transporter substrate-binding protein [Nitrospinaceae bacterium]
MRHLAKFIACLGWTGGIFCALIFSAPSPVRAIPDSAGITLGAILPLSGSNAVNGRAAQRAVQLAVKRKTHELTEQGITLRVVYEDDRMETAAGVRAARKLLTRDRVTAIIGPFSSSVFLAVAPLVNREKVILISGSATSPKIRNAGDFVFRTVSPDTYHGKAIARFAYEMLRARKAAVLFMNDEYGVGLKQVLVKEFSRMGAKIVSTFSFPRGETDFRSALEKIKEVHPHCVFLTAYPMEAGRALKQAGEMEIYLPFIGGDGMFSSKLAELVKDSPLEIYTTSTSWRPRSTKPRVREFVKAFQKRYGHQPNVYAAYYFDAAEVILDAMAHGARTPDQIRRFLHKNEFDGVTGKIRFDREGEVSKPIDIHKIELNRFEYFMTLQP